MTAEKPRRLGRGLEALIPGSTTASASVPASDLQRIPIARIRPNPFQPRREFDPAELAELEASLKASGLLQPISVRRRGDAFELIAGERRFRAATNLGWTDISAIVRDFDDRTMLVLALVENLQRANLNAIEEARGYRRLIDDFQLTQQQVAEAVGKDRTTVTNLLRVLSLPEAVQQLVEQGSLSPGHARALLALSGNADPLAVANDAIARGLSVRELEQLVRELSGGGDRTPESQRTSAKTSVSPSAAPDPAVRRIEDDLRRYLQTDVRVQLTGPEKGKIEVAFYSNDDLDRVLELILRDSRRDF
ncbi:MAG TPA: ParB/RepB/Spo0J family partition protein [Gemmatimonadaceae bacterium]|nr:ParB/RepB/Spo0J family partition protein [Gemmatimonadaceae bacterium]